MKNLPHPIQYQNKISDMSWHKTMGILSALMALAGCSVPFSGPFEGYVTDAESNKPIAGVMIEAEWWCHDIPIPDVPGSYFIRSSAITDESGFFRIERQTRRGGWFGTNFALKISIKGYIPATLIGDISDIPLPDQTKTYPFTDTSRYKFFPDKLFIRLRPAVPIFLREIGSDNHLYRSTARDELKKLFGVDYGYDSDKWEKCYKSDILKK